MPAKHSKNSGDRGFFTYHEKLKSGFNSIKTRLGSDSQLPFGYCSLSMHPAEDAMVSPSGHLYSKEFILEYLLTKSKELKNQLKLYEEQQNHIRKEEENKVIQQQTASITNFIDTHNGVKSALKRKVIDNSNDSHENNSIINNPSYIEARKKFIDDTDHESKMKNLSQVCPWVPQFTPQADASLVKLPSTRPTSPFSRQPLRVKDLIPIDLIIESSGSNSNSTIKYLCPVSRNTITNQKVLLIKTTGVYMIEQVYNDLAKPSMICPLSGKKFKSSDVLELQNATSSFAASGIVQGSLHKPTIN